jgi:hypothetical protein
MTPLEAKIQALRVQIKTRKRVARVAAIEEIAPLERELRTLQAYKRRNPDATDPPKKRFKFDPERPNRKMQLEPNVTPQVATDPFALLDTILND